MITHNQDCTDGLLLIFLNLFKIFYELEMDSNPGPCSSLGVEVTCTTTGELSWSPKVLF